MFYDKDNVDTHLKCENCKKRYDLPKVLTCGEVICEACLNNLKNVCDANQIKCPYCNDVHTIPKNGFPMQKVILSLLKIQPLKKFRGILIEELHDTTGELTQRLNKLIALNESSNVKIKHRGDEIRKIIDYASNKKRNELKSLETKFHERLDLFEKEAIEQMNFLIKNFINENQEKFKRWNDLAQNDNFDNEKNLLEAIHSISDLIKEIDLQEESLKKLVLKLEDIYFSVSTEDLIGSMIGELKIKNNIDNVKDENEQENQNKNNESKETSITAGQNSVQCKTK